MEQRFQLRIEELDQRESTMEAAVDRVSKTYGKVASYLAEKPDSGENALAIEGLRFLRSVREFGIQ